MVFLFFNSNVTERPPTFIIAEAGVNHNGDVNIAKKLIEAAAAAGADAVKFQTFIAEELSTHLAPMADYQITATKEQQSQLQMLEMLALSHEEQRSLKQYADQKNIIFLSTPFDRKSLKFLIDDLDIPIIKISSGDLTNSPLLFEVAKSGKPIILSTGMAEINEIYVALEIIASGYIGDNTPSFEACDSKSLSGKVALLHCVTEYPAPITELNVSAVVKLREEFSLPVGYSDHSEGTTAPIIAASLGACVIEKHLTLDKAMPGPDHGASMEPEEFKEMVRQIRIVEDAMGDGNKRCMPSEEKNREIARRSLVAAKKICKGEPLNESNIAVKRPANGISPFKYWEVIGKNADKDYEQDEPISKKIM